MESISGHIYTINTPIGSGTHSDVFSVSRADGQDFAFKRFKNPSRELGLGVLRELSILTILKDSHPGVVHLKDIIFLNDDQRMFGVILPKYSVDLHTAIQEGKIRLADRTSIAFRLSETVCFLHEQYVIHRDIKPENILLNDDWSPVLADYSLAKIFTGKCQEDTHTPGAGTSTYRAPEVISHQDYGLASDVWSLGVVFFELFTDSIPDMEDDASMFQFVSSKIPAFAQNRLGEMVRGMLSTDPHTRWSADRVLTSSFFKQQVESCHRTRSRWSTCRKPTRSRVVVTPAVFEMCENFEVTRVISQEAAQTYVDTTGCSAHSAVKLACKFYEPEAFETENEDCRDEEIQILRKMGYNLFV